MSMGMIAILQVNGQQQQQQPTSQSRLISSSTQALIKDKLERREGMIRRQGIKLELLWSD